MAARATSSGTISFGLVSIPIKVYPASSGKTVRFSMLHDKDKSRLIHLGMSVIQRISDDQTRDFRQRPEVHLAKRYVNTGDFQSNAPRCRWAD